MLIRISERMNHLLTKTPQDDFMGQVCQIEAVLQNMSEMLVENRTIILENSRKLDAIIKHLEVPYEKPPLGFSAE